MASGRSIHEVDEKKPSGFFPKLYENVISTMGNENLDKMTGYKDDEPGLIRYKNDCFI